MKRAWMRFWFSPAMPLDLAIARVLFYGVTLAFYGPVDFSEWGRVGDVYWMPIFAFGAAGLRPAPAWILGVMQVIWKLSMATAMCGLFTRASTWVAFLLGFYLLGLPHNFGKTDHIDAPLVIAFGLLALSRCGDALSLDRLIARRRDRSSPSGEYRWPIRAVRVAICLVFFASGVAKLRRSGLEWVTSGHLSTLLIKEQYYAPDAAPLTDLGLDIAAVPALCYAMAAATLFLELGYPLALLGIVPRLIFVPGMIGAQVGIRLLMGPNFFPFFVLNVFWIDWGDLLNRRKSRASTVQAAVNSPTTSKPAAS